MAYDLDDTIAAIATPPGGAARGMVRVSGPAARQTIAHCFEPINAAQLDAVHVPSVVAGTVVVQLHDAPRRIPCDLFLWPGSRSYTRQPVAELHTLGSPPLVQAVLEEVCRGGARLAGPGEFTLRAFLAGRLDLTQAEAVLGVIDAQRPDQLDAALRQLAGGIAAPLHRLRDELLALLAEIEAGLDFVEEDIEFISSNELAARLSSIAAALADVSRQMASRFAAGVTYQVVLIGPPNVGKSRLFNALAERFGTSDRPMVSAIVSDVRGTTRDYLVATLDLGGVRCELVDTAGVDDAPLDEIAAAAQRLADDRRRQAVLRAYCVDAPSTASAVVPHVDLVIVTKADLVPHEDEPFAAANDPPTVVTSSVTGEGLELLRQVLARLLAGDAAATAAGCVAATAERSRESVRLAESAVARAREIVASRGGDELVAAELRTALAELGKVVGAVYTDDILDRIFSSFCIGK